MTIAPLLVGVFAAMLTSSSTFAQCSQGSAETAAERARRDSGARYLIAVNAAEAQAQSERGRYAPLSELSGLPSAPFGFLPKLLFDQWSYVVILEDYFDRCGLALFSNERGIIYEGRPRRLPSQTSLEQKEKPLSPSEGASSGEHDPRDSSETVQDGSRIEK